jgi:hypothetical protein
MEVLIFSSHQNVLASTGPLLVHFQDRRTTVTSGRYSDMTCYTVKPEFHSEHPGLFPNCVHVLHDNALLHVVVPTIKTI